MNDAPRKSSSKSAPDTPTSDHQDAAAPKDNRPQPAGPLRKDGEPAADAAVEREPILVLNDQSEPLYADIIRRLDQRAVDHRNAAGRLLWIILLCVGASIALIAFAGTILGGDLQRALTQQKRIQDLAAQKTVSDTRLAEKNERAAVLKNEFDRTFLSRNLWSAATLPNAMTSRLTSVELRGTTGFAVGESQFVYTKDGGQSW
jgi:hypothetical protein